MTKKYEVIVNINSLIYEVEADNEAVAIKKAIKRFEESGDSTDLGVDYCTAEEVQ